MARPRVHGNRVSTMVRLPVDLHERLCAAATERDVSVNYLICKAISHYLDRLESVAEVASSATIGTVTTIRLNLPDGSSVPAEATVNEDGTVTIAADLPDTVHQVLFANTLRGLSVDFEKVP